MSGTAPATPDAPVSDEERLARAGLSRLAEPGDRALARLVSDHGPVAVLDDIRSGGSDAPSLTTYRSRLPHLHPERDLAQLERRGGRFVCPGELEWPTQLEDLTVPPLGLWIRGETDLRLAALRSVAVVGARAATSYGEYVAAELGANLGERGWAVVSGLAYGIDAAAHRGALAVAATTVAVLAAGVDVAYPRGHDGLMRRIVEDGVVVSELPPGCAPSRTRFLERNRVIAALTRGTVVVEAALRSGARSTAAHASRLARVVMAVPGPVTSPESAGCHEMIRAQQATLVTDAAEVLDLMGVIGADTAPSRHGPGRPTDPLDPIALKVHEALPARKYATVDTLATVAGLDVPTVLDGLGSLAAAGLAERSGAGWRVVRAIRRAPSAR